MLVDAGAEPTKIDRALEKFGMPVSGCASQARQQRVRELRGRASELTSSLPACRFCRAQMGVFRMADLSGIDVFKHVSGTFNAAYGSRCYNSTLGDKLYEAKRFGQKTGVGYYIYKNGKPVPDATLQPFIDGARAAASNKANIDGSKLSDDELVEATLFPVVNEALRIIDEGYALSESDVDVTSALGYGFPSWRGGVLHWAANHPKGGYKYVRDRLKTFATQWGGNNKIVAEFFKPCELLEKKANGQ
jgi:3-hydroxyacyl-CoA dehydrogenase